jgi:predicted aldo/keto reductase-like oxidoreductase
MFLLGRMSKRWIAGCATVEGTAAYAKRAADVSLTHWNKTTSDLTVSSIGVGTYMGDLKPETDIAMEAGVTNSVKSGYLNMIDTAINYRYQKAERCVGRALVDQRITGLLEKSFLFQAKSVTLPKMPTKESRHMRYSTS